MRIEPIYLPIRNKIYEYSEKKKKKLKNRYARIATLIYIC